VTGAYLPDAVEALVATGRAAEAEPLVDSLETSGVRMDRSWTLAVGARCRAMLLAASRDTAGAIEVAQRAMDHHQVGGLHRLSECLSYTVG